MQLSLVLQRLAFDRETKTDANGTNNETGLKASVSVKSSELLNMNTATTCRPSFGRRRGVLAAKFPGRPHREPGSKSSGDTKLHEKDKTMNADAGRGRGMAHVAGSNSSPGLTVTDGGRRLARNLGEQVKDDLNTALAISMNKNKEAEKHESSKEVFMKS